MVISSSEAVHRVGPDGATCCLCGQSLGGDWRPGETIALWDTAGPRGSWRTARRANCRATRRTNRRPRTESAAGSRPVAPVETLTETAARA